MQNSIQEIVQYWKSLRGSRSAPARSEIDPRQLRFRLPDLFILEQQQPDLFTFRLAGTRICAMAGRELRGSDMLGLWEPGSHEEVLNALWRVILNHEVIFMEASAEALVGEKEQFRMALLPLLPRPSEPERLLGVLCPADGSSIWLESGSMHKLSAGRSFVSRESRPRSRQPDDGGAMPMRRIFSDFLARLPVRLGEIKPRDA